MSLLRVGVYTVTDENSDVRLRVMVCPIFVSSIERISNDFCRCNSLLSSNLLSKLLIFKFAVTQFLRLMALG